MEGWGLTKVCLKAGGRQGEGKMGIPGPQPIALCMQLTRIVWLAKTAVKTPRLNKSLDPSGGSGQKISFGSPRKSGGKDAS